jgi:hypothetical protein
MSPAINPRARPQPILAGVLAAILAAPWARAGAPLQVPVYQSIEPRMADQTVVLTGKDLRLEDVVRVARFGAKVRLSAEARRRSEDAYGLLLEAAAEGVSVYWFNRGSGSNREKFIFTGDPLSPANRKFLEDRQAAIFARGATVGLGPEIDAEEIVRAMLLIRANSMTYEAASPQLTETLVRWQTPSKPSRLCSATWMRRLRSASCGSRIRFLRSRRRRPAWAGASSARSIPRCSCRKSKVS